MERGRCRDATLNVSRAPSKADVKSAGLVAGFPCAGHRWLNPTDCVSTYTDPSPPAICHATLFAAAQKLQPRTGGGVVGLDKEANVLGTKANSRSPSEMAAADLYRLRILTDPLYKRVPGTL